MEPPFRDSPEESNSTRRPLHLALFDHFIGAKEEDFGIVMSRALAVRRLMNSSKLCRQLHWQFLYPRTAQDTVDVRRRAPEQINCFDTIGNQPPSNTA